MTVPYTCAVYNNHKNTVPSTIHGCANVYLSADYSIRILETHFQTFMFVTYYLTVPKRCQFIY